jgi:hypothetical protein
MEEGNAGMKKEGRKAKEKGNYKLIIILNELSV